MHRINFWKREQNRSDDSASSRTQPSLSALTAPIRDAERRRLARLLVRRDNIDYDVAQAETAFMPQNRWKERTDQLDAAINQANEDLEQLKPDPSDTPTVDLPSTSIEIEIHSVDEPSEIEIRAGSETMVFREEVDWAERGHQIALPKLTHVEGDVTSLIPDGLSSDARQLLTTHLRNSFSVIANDALQRAIDGDALPRPTLRDLTRPCQECGGWLDPLGRCPACTRLDWERNELATAAARLIDERNDVLADLERTRERLPVFRRQLQDIERDIEELRAKGVEPE